MLFINGIRSLTNVVIVDFIRANLVLYVVSSRKVITMVVAQANERLYHDWHLTNASLFRAIKIFFCLHQQVNDFFH